MDVIFSVFKRNTPLVLWMSMSVLAAHWLCFSGVGFSGEPVILNNYQGYYPLGLYLDILEDKPGRWTIQEVQSPELAQRFFPNQVDVPNFGLTSSAHWLRINIQNLSQRREWILEVAFPLIDQVTLYHPVGKGKYRKEEGGELLPFSQKKLLYRNPAFVINIPPQTTLPFYLRLQDDGSVPYPITIWSPFTFAEKLNQELFGMGLYYGIILVMILYNAFIFISVRDESYFWYIGYLVAVGGFFLTYNGFAIEYLWPNSPHLSNQAIPLFMGMSCLSIARFTAVYLETRICAPTTDRVLKFVSFMGIVTMLVSLQKYYLWSVALSISVGLLTVCCALTAGCLSLIYGHRPARWYLLAWSVLLLSMYVMAIKVLGLFPSIFLTEFAPQIGTVIEVVMLSLGLADRINGLKLEKHIAQKTTIKAQQDALLSEKKAFEIEKESERKTHELKTAETLQHFLIPKEDPSLDEVEISSFYQSASETGGDWFDYHYYPKTKRLDVLIGDVTGHGVPAALVTAMATSFCEALGSPQIPSSYRNALKPGYPKELLNRLNRYLHHTIHGAYTMTFFYSILDLKNKKLIYTSAAHTPCLLWRPGHPTEAAQPSSLIKLNIRGKSLGEDAETVFSLRTQALQKNDVILWYTDGLTEGMNQAEIMFGLRSLKNVLKTSAELSAVEIKNKIIESAFQHYGTILPTDDITLIVARIN